MCVAPCRTSMIFSWSCPAEKGKFKWTTFSPGWESKARSEIIKRVTCPSQWTSEVGTNSAAGCQSPEAFELQYALHLDSVH